MDNKLCNYTYAGDHCCTEAESLHRNVGLLVPKVETLEDLGVQQAAQDRCTCPDSNKYATFALFLVQYVCFS